MVKAGGHFRVAALLVAVGALSMLASASASASTGEITRASTNSDWSSASIAAVVDRPIDCVQVPKPKEPPSKWPPEPGPAPIPDPKEYFPSCAWVPYATLGPDFPQDDCTSRERHWPHVGDDFQLVWSGDERNGAGSASFDLPDLHLEHGEAASLLCLSVVEAGTEAVFCPQIVGINCPPYAIAPRYFQLDSALLEVSSSGPGPAPSPGPLFSPGPPLAAASPSGEEPPSRPRRCRKARSMSAVAGQHKKGAGKGRGRCRSHPHGHR